MTDSGTTGTTAAERRRKPGRSPSYPGISLRTAVERAEKVYAAERRHAAPLEAITSAWGYTNPSSGNANVTVAALKKFGLLVEEKAGQERVLRLSDLALDILLSPNAQEAIRHAALLPAIHREMWDEYGNGLPSTETLRWKLIKRGFTESGVQDFLKEYRETIAFAKLDVSTPAAPVSAPPISDEEDDAIGMADLGETGGWDSTTTRGRGVPPQHAAPLQQVSPPQHPHQPVAPSAGLRIPIPLVGGTEVVYIEGAFPLTVQAWDQFIAMLLAMRPGLVAQETSG